MATKKLEDCLKEPYQTPVYYFASTEQPLLRETAVRVKKELLRMDPQAEISRVDGPEPDLGEVIASAGAISFFGTPRVVEIREMMISSMKDKDVDELAELFGQLENAVLLVTCLYKDKRVAGGKKSKLLLQAAEKNGFAQVLEKPTRRDNLAYMQEQAGLLGAKFAPGAAESLLERAGDDRPLLASEVAKLAAFSGYTRITTEMVQKYGAHNIEADVFQLARYITSGQSGAAQEKLAELLALKNEPIAIVGALSGTYVDMYRVRAALESRRTLADVARDFGYSSEYRVQKAKENSARYTTENLRQCILRLSQLDKELKSSALSDKTPLLQATVGALMLLGGKNGTSAFR